MNEKEFLSFSDYIDNENKSADWVIIANHDEKKHEDGRVDDFSTISYLAPNEQRVIDEIFKRHSWEISVDFGHPYFEDRNGEVHLNTGYEIIGEDIMIESFVIRRYYDGLFPEKTEIIQNFILYHNLFYDSSKNAYIEPITQEIVIEYIDNNHVRMRTNFLREYLAARKMILVICYDHRRRVPKPVLDIINQNRLQFDIKTAHQNYSVIIAAGSFNKNNTLSRLIGKSIVIPFAKPSHENYKYLVGEEDECENFIVGIDETTGKPMERTCKQDGGMEFLSHVFFKKEVLQKYYDNSRLYTVEPMRIYHLNDWGITYGISKEDLVHVLLGDLQCLPHKEQLHWKQYNIPPKEGLSKSFMETQFMAKFSDSKDPVHKILNTRKEVNAKFEKNYGFKLLKDLSEDDKHVIGTVHTLTTNEQSEFDQQALYLAKILIDSLDIKKLREVVTSYIPQEGQEGHSIPYLHYFLIEKLSFEEGQATQVSDAFRMIQTIRSAASAHRKSQNYDQTLKRYDLQNLDNSGRFKKIVSILDTQLALINKSIS